MHAHTVGLEWRRHPLPTLLVGAGRGVETQSGRRYSSSRPLMPPNSDAIRPTHVSVHNPHQPGAAEGKGGVAPTLPPLGEPQRPNHTPFLLGLARLGSRRLATPAPKIGSPARQGVRPGGEGWGTLTPIRLSPAERRPPSLAVTRRALWTPWPRAGCTAPSGLPSQPHPSCALPNQQL